MSLENIKNYLAKQNKNVVNKFGIKVFKLDNVQPCVYHIRLEDKDEFNDTFDFYAINKYKDFVFKDSVIGENEDDSIPRVHTATTLLGCITGIPYFWKYKTTINNIKNHLDKIEYHEDMRNKIFRIYEIKADYALYPTKSPDVDYNKTQEIWLVNYNEDRIEEVNDEIQVFPEVTSVYRGNCIGEFYITDRETKSIKYNNEDKVFIKAIFRLKIFNNKELILYSNCKLKSGYYEFNSNIGDILRTYYYNRYDDKEVLDIINKNNLDMDYLITTVKNISNNTYNRFEISFENKKYKFLDI